MREGQHRRTGAHISQRWRWNVFAMENKVLFSVGRSLELRSDPHAMCRFGHKNFA